MLPPEQILDRRRRLEAIFHEVLGTPAEQQTARLESLCAGDSVLYQEAVSMLEAATGGGHFSETLPSHEGVSGGRPWESQIGRRFGPYQLERLVGRGGLGAVYLAYRADGGFEQQVAIKIIGLPLEIETFRERFRRERQILAALNHPNITRLLDGGVTDEGQLYLVMEYVDGAPIGQFETDLGKKLDMFRGVCAAVQYAHQNLVVHRDIKPSNILVDSSGTPKLLDFGAAKLMDDADLTQTGFGMMTVAYASPEQLTGKPATTLSDVYSLGVVLYELASGVRAFGDDIVSRMRDVEAGVVRLPKPLTGDLGRVIEKALAPSAVERYSSVEQLAEDVRRFQHGEPVLAHPPSLRYRAGKLARRHKLAIGAAALLLATILAGIAGVLWQYRVANAERRRAVARAEDLRKLSDSLLTEIDEAIQKIPGSTAAQTLLVHAVVEHLDRAARDSAGDPQLQLDTANGYIRLGNVQGNPYDQNIGDIQGALASLDKAIAVSKNLVKEQPANPAAKHALAWAHQSRSEVLFGVGRTQEAVDAMRGAVAEFEELASRPGAPVDALLDAGSADGGLGDELGQNGVASLSDMPGALASYRKGREVYERVLQIEPGNLRALRGMAVAHRKLAAILVQTDPAAALPECRKAVDEIAALPDELRNSLGTRRIEAIILTIYGVALSEIGQYRQALDIFERGRATAQTLLEADPKDTRAANDLLAVLSNEAECLQQAAAGIFPEAGANRMEDAASALKVLAEERSILEGLLRIEPEHLERRSALGITLIEISRQQLALNQPQGSLELAQKGIGILKEVGRSKKEAQTFALYNIATGLLTVEPSTLREPALALKFAERIVEMSSRRKPEYFLTLAMAYRAAEEPDKARSAALEGLALLPAETAATVPSRLRKLLHEQAGM